jgi:hypothetical protein
MRSLSLGVVAMLAILAILAAGCSTLQRNGAIAEREQTASASAAPSVAPLEGMSLRSPVDPAVIPFEYRCDGRVGFTAADLTAPPVGVADLSPLNGFAQEEVERATPGTAWRLVFDEGPRRLLVRVTSPSHVEYVRLEYQTYAGASGGILWAYAGSGDCEPWAWFKGEGQGGYLRFDDDAPRPRASSRRLHLLVSYLLACRSEVRVTGRPRVVMTDEAVIIGVPVRTRLAGDMCIEGQPTRITVRLPEPLGDRVVYDGGTLPIRRIR